MRFEVSERIPTTRSEKEIADALEQQLRKVSGKVHRVGNSFTATNIADTFGSINRKVETAVSLKTVPDGYLAIADVNYRPSVIFWAFIVIGLFSWILWILPIVFYFLHKNLVRNAIEECLRRVKNEFLQQPAIGQPVLVQAIATPHPAIVVPPPPPGSKPRLRCFVYLDDEVKGPFDRGQLKALIDAKQINGTTQGCLEGTESWQPLSVLRKSL